MVNPVAPAADVALKRFLVASPEPEWARLSWGSTPDVQVSLECREYGRGTMAIDHVSLSHEGRARTRLGYFPWQEEQAGWASLRFALKNVEVAAGIDRLPPVYVRVVVEGESPQWMTPSDYEESRAHFYEFDRLGVPTVLMIALAVFVTVCFLVVLFS